VRIPLELILLSILTAITSLASGQTTQPTQKPSFSITINAPEEVVNAGSNVALEVVMTNISNQDIAAGELLGGAELNYDIDVFDGNGKPAPETSIGRKLHGKDPNSHGLHGSIMSHSLKPGETQKARTFLNKIYDLQPGNYTAQAQRRDPVSKTIVKSNIIRFTVTP
jgi:hypothetical protein